MTRHSAYRAAIAVAVSITATTMLTGCGPTAARMDGSGANGPASAAAAPTATAGAPTATAGGGGPLVDPCTLITEDDAATAIGKPSGPGVPGGTPDAPQCLYGDGILIVIVDGTGKDGYASNHAGLAGGPSGSSQDVSGIGDGAFEVSGGPTALVYFYKGTTQVEIMLQGTLTAPAAAAITVARAAAATL